MTEHKTQSAELLDLVIEAVEETVAAAGPNGTNAGFLYSAFMQYGLGLNEFYKLMDLVLRRGKIEAFGYHQFRAVTK